MAVRTSSKSATEDGDTTGALPAVSGRGVSAPEKKGRKDVPGNFSYSFTPGRFKETLQAMIAAERPASFNRDFIETILNVKGGSVTAFPPILKRLGFLSADNSPTELYGQFQSESSRSTAALAGLKNGFAELFKKNAHVHRADDAKIRDYLVQITGRKKDDQVINAVLGTFNAVKSFITVDPDAQVENGQINQDRNIDNGSNGSSSLGLGLSYHINIVLPETKDVAVFNAIFQSLKQNLLS